MNTENITTPRDRKIGEILIEEGLINETQLQDAYQAQSTTRKYKPIGQILVDQELITQKQINYLLDCNWKRARLGDILVRSGVITKDLVDIALSKQKESGIRLGEELVKQNFISEKVMKQVLCTQLNIPYVNLDDMKIDRSLIKLINKNYALHNHVVPVAKHCDTLTLAMADPTCSWLVDELEAMTGLAVSVITSTNSAIKSAFSRLYERKELADTSTEFEMIEEETDKIAETKPLNEIETSKTADSLVSHIINQSIKNGASDIHIESGPHRLNIRYRIDGVLKEPFLGTLQDDINRNQKEIISRTKIMGKLDIAERRRPQDGSFRARIMKAGKPVKIDFRISIIPGYFGENIVIRILDSRKAPKSLEQLGFSEKITNQLHQLLKRNEGLILITGPTGSGKSTTLYGALMSIYRPGTKILTAEDPIEYVYDNISQCQVDEKIGNTFANYIRAFLRQDPEVIMVGEIRDSETAQMALRAAQTGHMVLSTLHTNDTYSSILRLSGLKVDANLIASCLIGVLSQRLIRQICPHCKEEYNPTDELLKEFFSSGAPKIKWYRGGKCSSCNYTGYLGRLGVSQLWSPSDKDILLINKGLLEELRESSDQSTIFMIEDAMTLLKEGKTNLEELIRTLPYSCIFQFHKLAEHFL